MSVAKAFMSADIHLYKPKTISISKTDFTTFVAACHLKQLAEKQCCN